jgi:hypothetical protein
MAEEPDAVADDPVAAIRTDIRQTRARIATTIDAIEARVRPSRMLSDARQSLADAAARPARAMGMHPLVSLLAALGTIVLAGAFFRRRRRRAAKSSS